jgi:hypothetical protein
VPVEWQSISEAIRPPETGNRGIVRLRHEPADGFLAVPVALDLQAGTVEPPAAVTMAGIIRIVILKRFFHF